MSLAHDLEQQILEVQLKRDSYVRLAQSAHCPDLAHRYVDKLVDIDAHLERLRLALAATPERRYRRRVSEADDDDKTRVRRVPTTKYRAVG